MSKICIPIHETDTKKFLAAFSKASKHADIIEVWLDEVKNPDAVIPKLQKSKKPILYKVTAKSAHSNFHGDYIDFDFKAKPIKHTKLIISYHNFEKTPTDVQLKKIIQKMSKHSPYIYKIATKANSFSDSLRMLKLLDELHRSGKRAVCICMGREGKITRAAGHLFGNYLMFAPLDEKKATAPGQISLKELKKIHNLL